MPTYTFKDNNTGFTYDEFMGMNEREKYLKDNPQTVVSLLYLDFGPYEPTKVALENFLPRMPKGSIVAFEVLNNKGYTGETKAALDSVGISNLRLQRFNFESNMSYAIIE